MSPRRARRVLETRGARALPAVRSWIFVRVNAVVRRCLIGVQAYCHSIAVSAHFMCARVEGSFCGWITVPRGALRSVLCTAGCRSVAAEHTVRSPLHSITSLPRIVILLREIRTLYYTTSFYGDFIYSACYACCAARFTLRARAASAPPSFARSSLILQLLDAQHRTTSR